MKPPLPSPFEDDSPAASPRSDAPIIPLGLHVSADAATIIFRCEFWSQVGNNLAFMLLHPGLLSVNLIGATLLSFVNPSLPRRFGIESSALVWLSYFVFLLILNTAMAIRKTRDFRNSERGEAMTIGPQELRYATPNSVRHMPWPSVKLIFDVAGSLYVVQLDSVNYVPHDAFPTPATRQLFLEAARTLQKSRGAIWPADLVAQMAAPAL